MVGTYILGVLALSTSGLVLSRWGNDESTPKGWQVFTTLFYLAVIFLIEPFYILGALTSNIGNKQFGFVALVAVGVLWVQIAKVLRSAARPKTVTVETKDGNKVEGRLTTVPKPNWLIRFLKKTFWLTLNLVPVAYLWYMFALAIGVESPF